MSVEGTRKKYSSLSMFAKRGLMTTSAPSDHQVGAAPAFTPVGSGLAYSKSVKEFNEAPLAADRAVQSNPFFGDITPKKDLLISLSAAKLLTELTASVVKGPTGPGDVDGLDRLISESHRLADAWCRQLVTDEKPIPLYLRSQMLKQAVSFLSREWEKKGHVDVKPILQLSGEVFSSQVGSLSQEIADLLNSESEYTAPDSPEKAEQQVQILCSKIYWNLFYAARSIDGSWYGLEGLLENKEHLFLYGNSAETIAADLLELVISIADENRIESTDIELMLAWYRNALSRLSNLISSNYVTITRMIVQDSTESSEILPAGVQRMNAMYQDVLAKCRSIARNQFIQAEKIATEKMMASKFTYFLGEQNKQPEQSNPTSKVPGFSFAPLDKVGTKTNPHQFQTNEFKNDIPGTTRQQPNAPTFVFGQK